MTTKQAREQFIYFKECVYLKKPVNLTMVYKKPYYLKIVAFNEIVRFATSVEITYKVHTSNVYITGANTSTFVTMFGIFVDGVLKYVVKDTKAKRKVFDKDGQFWTPNEMWKYLEVRQND